LSSPGWWRSTRLIKHDSESRANKSCALGRCSQQKSRRTMRCSGSSSSYG
jgi:hypothetical protein